MLLIKNIGGLKSSNRCDTKWSVFIKKRGRKNPFHIRGQFASKKLAASWPRRWKSKLIKTQKGTLLVVPCLKDQDEKLILVTLRGGFRGNYSRVEAVGVEILSNKSGNMHCCPTGHLIVRLTDPKGYVFAETGRRCGTGLVEVFSWDGYKTMPIEEFKVWQECCKNRP